MIIRKLIKSIMRIVRMIRTMRKIFMGMEMTVKPLEEIVKVIIPIITLLLSIFP